MTLKTTRDLVKGDVVINYMAEFEVLDDARESEHRPGVFTAPCKRVDTQDLGSLNGILDRYDSFQSTVHHEWFVKYKEVSDAV
jgi:hypothetical protein